MSKDIQLTKGRKAKVDDEDYEKINTLKWHCDSHGYAMRKDWSSGLEQKVLMHRLILNAPKGTLVDHINHDILDNRKKNLRLATRAENNRNALPYQNTTSGGLKGVTWRKRDKCWAAQINENGTKRFLGNYKTKEEAAIAYDKAAKSLFGSFAWLNFP